MSPFHQSYRRWSIQSRLIKSFHFLPFLKYRDPLELNRKILIFIHYQYLQLQIHRFVKLFKNPRDTEHSSSVKGKASKQFCQDLLCRKYSSLSHK